MRGIGGRSLLAILCCICAAEEEEGRVKGIGACAESSRGGNKVESLSKSFWAIAVLDVLRLFLSIYSGARAGDDNDGEETILLMSSSYSLDE